MVRARGELIGPSAKCEGPMGTVFGCVGKATRPIRPGGEEREKDPILDQDVRPSHPSVDLTAARAGPEPRPITAPGAGWGAALVKASIAGDLHVLRSRLLVEDEPRARSTACDRESRPVVGDPVGLHGDAARPTTVGPARGKRMERARTFADS
jgi:hypothetical protein